MSNTQINDGLKALDSCVRACEALGSIVMVTNYNEVREARAALERMNVAMGKLYVERQNVTVTADRLELIDSILRRLPTMEEPSREQVAKLVRDFGMAAYVGGRHISIHTPDASGEPDGVCLVMISGNYGDWL